MIEGRGCESLPLLFHRSETARNGGDLVAEYFVDDGDDVGDGKCAVGVHVACLGGEGDYHLRVCRDGAGKNVVLDVDGDVESVEDDLVKLAA